MKSIPIRHIKSPPREPNLSEDFSIRDIVDMLDGKDMTQELHRHDFFFILLLKKGSGNHEIDFNSYKVCNDVIFFMRPGQVHQFNLKAGSSGYLMQFNRDFYSPKDKVAGQRLRRASSKSLCQLDSKKVNILLAIMNSIFREYTDKQEGFLDVVKANLGIFLVELIRTRQIDKSPTNVANPYQQERLEELCELIETRITTHKHVSQYADMLNLSSYQLNAITRMTLGKSCSELINEFIILESKRSLLATSNQVNQIAYQLGYEDVSYFIRFFKKHIGQTPEVFRTNHR
jgi:AraC family transcriptional regulator, transcriptional activator of pobA